MPLIALLGAAAAVLPAVASSETSPVVVATNGSGLYGTPHTWSPSEATVIAGGVVRFSNPSTTYHGLRFTGGSAGAAPSCTGLPPGATGEGGATNWEGQCTFNAAGTYTFICTVHPVEMKGTITVDAGGATTVTTTPTTPPPPPTPTATVPSETPGPTSPLSGKPALRTSQRGGLVKGSLVISKAGAGDELEIDLLAATASLASNHRQARVGRLFRASVSAGRLPFSVRLNRRGRRALAHRHRLVLTVRIVLTPVYGEPTTISRSVVEHG